ncbi:MAG: hypothetical protein A2138_24115 [Deltaproteobacteria bacterium RBG_16_71_12]|nr:MAG: hypothetical protein A2138_24115 [Deltaproteobacteria bacterium RBG_16_71_12]
MWCDRGDHHLGGVLGAAHGDRLLRLAQGQEGDAERNLAPALEQRLALLEKHNAELRERVETLETIATGMDARQLGAEGALELKELEQRLQTVTKKV